MITVTIWHKFVMKMEYAKTLGYNQILITRFDNKLGANTMSCLNLFVFVCGEGGGGDLYNITDITISRLYTNPIVKNISIKIHYVLPTQLSTHD